PGRFLRRQHSENGSEIECAPAVFFTFDPDLSFHQFNKPRGNRQAETGAAILASGGAIGLREGLKDECLFVPGNADAGVGNGKEHFDAFTTRGPCGYVYRHTSLVSELQ